MTSKTDPNYGRGEAVVGTQDSFAPVLKLIRDRIKLLVEEQTFEIPLLPHVAAQVLQMANDPKAGLADLEKLIKQDPVIAARILQVSNSPFYRGVSTIVSLRDAMNRMGLKMMKDIVFSLSIKGKIFQIKGFEKQLEAIWEHSISCAAISQLMAKRLGVDSEYAFLAGLLHDIGKVVLIQLVAKIGEEERKKKADEAKKLFKPFDPKSFDLTKINEMLLPLAYKDYHAPVGAIASMKWKLPDLITEVIRFHHEHIKADQARTIATVVHLANMLCHHFGYGHEEAPFNFLGEKAFYELNFTSDQVKKLVDEIPEAVSGLRAAF